MTTTSSTKDSRIEWVGEIPSHWDTLDLMWCCEENRQINRTGHQTNVLSLSYGRIVRRDVESNHGLLPASFETYQIVRPGQLVLRLTDLQNDKRSLRVGLVAEDGIITSAYVGLTPRASLDSRFAFYLLHSYDTTKVFYGFGGGVRQSMKFEDLKHLPLVLPPLPTQRAIAAFLDRKTAAIDALIEKKQRLLDLLDEKRTTLITQAVTKGLDPSVPMKDSGIPWIGKVPKHWTFTKPKFACTRIVDGTHHTPQYVGEGVHFVTVKNLTAGPGISLEDTKFVSESNHIDLCRRANPEVGDVLISKDGTLGVTRVIEDPTPFSIFVSVALLKLRKQKVRPWFLRYAFESDALWQQFEFRKSGSGLKHLILSDIGNVLVPCPGLDEQLQIIDSLKCSLGILDDAATAIGSHIGLLREYRQSLITAAATGQLPIPEDVA